MRAGPLFQAIAITAFVANILPVTAEPLSIDGERVSRGTDRAGSETRSRIIRSAPDRRAAEVASRSYYTRQVAIYCITAGILSEPKELADADDAVKGVEAMTGLSQASLSDLWDANRKITIKRLDGDDAEGLRDQCNAAADHGEAARFLEKRQMDDAVKTKPAEAIPVGKSF